MKINTLTLLSIITSVMLIVSCQPEEVQTTEEYYAINKAVLNPGFPLLVEQDSLSYISSVVKLGTVNLKTYGICYGLKLNPTFAETVIYSKKALDSIPFSFPVKIKNLAIGTTYQVRSFVTTARDTIYGPNNFFRTHGRNEWVTRTPTIYPNNVATVANPKGSDYSVATFFSAKNIFMFFQNENTLRMYDIGTYAWTSRKTLPSTLNGQTQKYTFMLNGKGYCGNLLNTGTQLTTEFWEYDIATDSWKNLDSNKPDLQTEYSYGFTDGKYGYLTSYNKNTRWQVWRFDAAIQKWSLLSESLINLNILNVFSDGTNTFALTNNKAIYKFNGQQWEYFMDISGLFKNNAYFGWVYKNSLLLGEYIGGVSSSANPMVSIDILSKAIDKQITVRDFRNLSAIGAYQTTQKLFFSETRYNLSAGGAISTPVSLEYYPKY